MSATRAVGFTNLEAFNLEIFGFAKKVLPKKFEQFIRVLALTGLRRIVLRTPVKKGRARGGWQVDIDSIPEGQTELLDKAGQVAIARGAAVLASLPDNGIGHIIYFANNVNYIVKLEEGGSGQAPSGMAAITIEELRGTVKE